MTSEKTPLLVRRGASEAMRGGQGCRRFSRSAFRKMPSLLTTPTALCAVTPPHEEGSLLLNTRCAHG
jgi:hypothetical protein